MGINSRVCSSGLTLNSVNAVLLDLAKKGVIHVHDKGDGRVIQCVCKINER